jgi:hypothetical protein
MAVVVLVRISIFRSRHSSRDSSCRERRRDTVSSHARCRRRAHTAAADRHRKQVLTPDVIAKRTKRRLEELEVCVAYPTDAV